MSVTSFGVKCYTCGLEMSRSFPTEVKREQYGTDWEKACLIEAIEAWNKRA